MIVKKYIVVCVDEVFGLQCIRFSLHNIRGVHSEVSFYVNIYHGCQSIVLKPFHKYHFENKNACVMVQMSFQIGYKSPIYM